MSLTIEPPKIEIAPIFGLDNQFPDQVYVLHHVPSKRYGCYCYQNVHGLACFSTAAGANQFGTFIDLDGLVVEAVTFDEAREIAKARPMPVTAMFLLDNMSDPIMHFIR